MKCNRNEWFGCALLLIVVGCGVDSGVSAPDAGTDAGTEAGTDAGTEAGTDAATDMIVNAANNPFPCLNPAAAPTLGEGFLQCASGQYVRPHPPECPASDVPASDACRKQSDCATGMGCSCASPASGLGNTCQAFNTDDDCRSTEDCEPGFHCAYVTIGFSDWAIWRLRCQKPLDECAVNSDCVALGEDAGFVNSLPNPLCQADSQGRVCCDPITWTCQR